MQAMERKDARNSLRVVEPPDFDAEQDPEEGLGVFRGVLFTFLVYAVFAGMLSLGWFFFTHLQIRMHH